MASFGYFRLEHSSVNRATQGDGYLAAHANYAANQNKCEKVIHINMAENRHAIRDYIQRHEEGISRKNARLGDKILLSLPTELSEEHREQAVRRFLWTITGQGQTRAVAFYHTDHAHNPHCHVVLLDRHIETGASVMQMGANRRNRLRAGLEPNATEWLRKVWEKECNAVCEANGYEIVMDRRSNLERGLPDPEQHRGWDNDNELPADIGEQPAELEPEPEVDTVTDLGEEQMAVIHIDRDENISYAAHKIRLLKATLEHQAYLNHSRQRVKDAEVTRKKLLARVAEAKAEHGIYIEQTTETLKKARNAQDRLEEYQNNGKLKGIGVKLFGFELKTPTRKRAEEALSEYERLRPSAEYMENKRASLAEVATMSEKQAEEAAEKAFMARQELERLYGSEEDLVEAATTLANTIRENGDVPWQFAHEAFLTLEITEEEYEAYLVQGGYEEKLATFRENRAKYVTIDAPDPDGYDP